MGIIFHHTTAEPRDHWPAIPFPVTGFHGQSENQWNYPGASLQISSSWSWYQQTACVVSLAFNKSLLGCTWEPSSLGWHSMGQASINTGWASQECGWGNLARGFPSATQHCPCSEMWHSLRPFEMFTFQLFNLSEELASISSLCLQPRYLALALSPAWDPRSHDSRTLMAHMCAQVF